VALSADAMPEHQRLSRLAGVDAHLAKPFTSATLRAAVEAHLAPAPPTLDALNPVVAGMARTYGEPAVRSLLQSLLAQLDRFPGSAIARAELAHRAHAARGAAASMGFGAIASACGELERSCRDGDVVDQPFRRAAEACDRGRRDIEACLQAAA
jgi:HPt (histidine-containing phosphotransfer) domain-containing protein